MHSYFVCCLIFPSSLDKLSVLSVQQKVLCDCFFSTSTKKQFQLKLVKSGVEMKFWVPRGGGDDTSVACN